MYRSKNKIKSSLHKSKYFLFIICTWSFLFSSSKLLASSLRPTYGTSDRHLSLDYNECKSKASQVADFVLIENTRGESPDNTVFQVRGRTSASRAMLVCMKQNRGVHFAVVVFSQSYGDQETKSLRDRITDFMSN